MNKLIFDTDPGIDDVIALLVAKQLNLDVKLIVSTYGNVSHEHTDRNARDISDILKFGCPVLYGADDPISGSPFTAEYVHGYNGLGNIDLDILSEPSIKVDDYTDYYYQTIIENAPVDIIALGPLTNLASVITKYPDAKQYISSLYVMGYGLNVFNVNDISEFNVICDPLAADIIANAHLPITVVPLDVTHKAQLSIKEVEEIKGYLNQKKEYSVFGEVLQYLYDSSVKQGDEGAIVHDATAVIAYFYPQLFEFEYYKINVLPSGETKYQKSADGIKFAMNIDRPQYIETMTNLFKKI